MLEVNILLPILFLIFSILEINTMTQPTIAKLPKNWVKRSQNRKNHQMDGLDRLEYLTAMPIEPERLKLNYTYTYEKEIT